MNLKLSLEDQIEMLTADVDAIGFYKSLGFERAKKQCLGGFMPKMSIDTLNSDRSSYFFSSDQSLFSSILSLKKINSIARIG